MSVTVGSTRFTDQAYADDGVLFTDCRSKWPEILTAFDAAAETMRLHTSWQKTKVQNIGHGTPPSSVYMQASGQTVEAVDLGSDINSNGRSTQETHRRIRIVCSIMGRLSNVWQQSRLSLATKLRVYNSLVLSVLLYGCETWTVLKSDERKLEAFHMSYQRRILRIRWFHRVTIAEVTSQTEQEDLTSHIRRRRAVVFGHVRRLPEEAPGQMAMRLADDTRAGGDQDDRDTPGSDKWRTTPVPPLMSHGTLPSTAAVEGRYDPSWSSVTDDDDVSIVLMNK